MREIYRQILITFFVFCGFLFSAAVTLACSCAENDLVDKEFARATNVVILKAISGLDRSKDGANADERISGFKFNVQRAYKGKMKPGQEFDVVSSGMCSFGFYVGDLGSEFLMYYTDDIFFIVPACTRSGRAKWRAADISYLEKMAKVRGRTRLSGIISQSIRKAVEGEIDADRPLEDHTVRVSGHGRFILLKTDAQGVYEIYGLPSGQYRIEPENIKGYQARHDFTEKSESGSVILFDNGHAEMNFDFGIDNAISGRVVDANGKPLEGIKLELIPSRGNPRKYFVEIDYSEKDGSFEFEDIPAGSYVIMGNPKNEITAENPYPTFYSSGTGLRATATEITIGPGEFLVGFLVKAPKPAETVTISGILIFEDGTPVPSGTVKFVTGNEDNRAPGDAYAYPDKNGKFRMTILKGQKGMIYGYVVPNTWTFRNCLDRLESVKLKAKKDKNGFPESTREKLETVADMNGIELRFPFTFCAEGK